MKLFNRLAFLFSTFFSPTLLTIFMLINFVIVLKPAWQITASWIASLVVVLGYFVWGLKTGKFSDSDIRKRTQRRPLLALAVIMTVLSYIVVVIFGTTLLKNYMTIFLVWLFVFAGITYFWKISGHTSVSTLIFFLLNSVHNWYQPLILLFFFIPFIAWSRVYRKNHTLAQVIGGIVLAFAIASGGFWVFDFW